MGNMPAKQLIWSAMSSSSQSSSSLKMLMPPAVRPRGVGRRPVLMAAEKGVMLYVYFSLNSARWGSGNGPMAYTSYTHRRNIEMVVRRESLHMSCRCAQYHYMVGGCRETSWSSEMSHYSYMDVPICYFNNIFISCRKSHEPGI